MPTFIKTGFWEKARKGAKDWLNLDLLIQSIAGSITNTVTTLIDGANITISDPVNSLESSQATITFDITYPGDITETEVTLNTTSATYTFPSTTLCINSDGAASGDNTATLSGVAGDKYLIMTNKIGVNYYTIVTNFGQ